MRYILISTVLIVLQFFIIISCNPKKQANQISEEKITQLPEVGKTEEIKTDTPEAIVDSRPEAAEVSIDTLIGRWLRPDGNYVIQINAINTDNKIDAEYFNPRPINIARAEIIADDKFRIFIEFDDRGYEGSSYDLIYDPVNDALTGKYFQATYGQSYQIGFIRLKE
jgi:hypothetical protein